MKYKTRKLKNGFTLIELMITVLIMSLVFFGLGTILVDGHRSYNRLYKHVTSEAVRQSHETRRIFDRIVRQADSGTIVIGAGNASVRVDYYAVPSTATALDRRAEFFFLGTELTLKTTTLTGTLLSSQVICSNVTNCIFEKVDHSVKMDLDISEIVASTGETITLEVRAQAFAHN